MPAFRNQKRFIIVPGFFCEDSIQKNVKSYLDLIRSKLFMYEVESKFELSFLCEKEKKKVKFYLKSIDKPFVVLLLREVSGDDIYFYDKFARKNKHCKVYYEGQIDSIVYHEEEKNSIKEVNDFTEKLEFFLMITKRDHDVQVK